MSIAEISELIGLIATGFGLIVAVVGWVKTIIKDIKDKKLKALIEEYMAQAEKISQDGATKKIFVITNVLENIKDKSKGMVEKIEAYIEKCIDFSKKVNAKGDK